MTDAVPRVSPLDVNQQLTADGATIGVNVPFNEALGKQLWIATNTRPGISHSLKMLARHMSNSKQQHWNALKGVLRYLRGTVNLGLLYRSDGGSLVGYSDSDYAGDPMKRRRTSG